MYIPKLIKTAGIATVALFGFIHVTAYAENVVDNGAFENGYYPWEPPGWWADGDGIYEVDEQGRFCITITTLGFAN